MNVSYRYHDMLRQAQHDKMREFRLFTRLSLLTSDKDFGDLVFRLRRLSAGVILIRLAGLTPAKKAAIVAAVISKHSQELAKAFTVITPLGVRIRSSVKR